MNYLSPILASPGMILVRKIYGVQLLIRQVTIQDTFARVIYLPRVLGTDCAYIQRDLRLKSQPSIYIGDALSRSVRWLYLTKFGHRLYPGQAHR
jgi:hypothetical protein